MPNDNVTVRRCFIPEKLYAVRKHCWYMFQTKEIASHPSGSSTAIGANSRAPYWSHMLQCTVSFLNKGDTFMIVEVSGEQVKVINQEGKGGWINFPTNEEWTIGTITAID